MTATNPSTPIAAKKSSFPRPMVKFIGLALVAFATAYLSIRLTRLSGRIALVSLANAVVLTTLLKKPPAEWWSRLLAGFLGTSAGSLMAGDLPSLAILLSVCHTMEVIVAAGLLHYFQPQEGFDLKRWSSLKRFLIVSGFVAPALSSLLAAAILRAMQGTPFEDSLRALYEAAALGILLLTPLLSTTTVKDLVDTFQRHLLRERLAIMGFVALAAVTAFRKTEVPLLWMLFPAALLAVFQLGRAGALLAILMIAAIGFGSALFSSDFMPLSATWRFADRLILLQVLLACLAITVLLVGTGVEELRDAEARYRELFGLSPLTIWVVDAVSLRFLAVNAAAIRNYGYSVDEFLAMTLTDLRPAEDRPTAEETQKSGTHQTIRAEFRHRTKEGKLIQVAMVSRPFSFARRAARIMAVEDITERRQAERMLRETNELNRKIFQASPTGITVFDEAGLCLAVNDAVSRITDVPLAELRKQNFRQLQSWRSSGLLDEALKALSSENSRRGEFHMISSAGKELWLECSFKSFEENGARRLLLVSADISDRVLAQAEVTQVRRSLANILDGVQTLISYWDAGLRNRFANRAYKEWFGWTGDEIHGRQLRDVIGEAAYQENLARFQGVLSGVPQSYEATYSTSQGDRETLVSYLPDIQNGIIEGFLAQVVDVTPLKQAQRAAQASNQAKTEFLATISHEIRTPLNAVIGYSTLLLDTPLSSKQLDYVQSVRTAADALLALINTILDLSKIESDKLELEQVSTDLRLAMEDALEILAEAAGRKGLNMTCLCAPDCPTHIICDPGRLRQVLINLVSNAVKFTDSGEIIIRASRLDDPIAPRVRIEVIDTGPGIPVDALPMLFQPFSQVDASMARRHGGTGLGLSLSRRLVERMGGLAGVESCVGAGSTFWITLPLIPAAASESEFLALPSRTRGQLILVVDGHAASREQIGQLLSEMQLVPVLCESAMAARAALAANTNGPMVAIFLSGTLPDADPEGFAKELRDHPQLQRLPMVRLLAASDQREVDQALPPGFAKQILKPLRARRLARLLQELLGLPSRRSVSSSPRKPTNLELFRSDRPPPRLLLAEDNPANQRLAALMLLSTGCRVDLAANGREAVSAASRFPYDLIVMDCQMPELDGLAAAGEIRKLPYPAGRVPIIALTANAFRTDREACLAAGMNDFITKPFTVEGLRQVLLRWLPDHVAEATPSTLEEAVLKEEIASIRQRRNEIASMLDEQIAEQSIKMFEQDWAKLLGTARSQLQEGLPEQLSRTAHRLAGGALEIGAKSLAQSCKELEMVAARKDNKTAAKLLGDIEVKLGEILLRLGKGPEPAALDAGPPPSR